MNNIIAATSSSTKSANVLQYNNNANYTIQRHQYQQMFQTPTEELQVKRWFSNTQNRDSSSVISRRAAAGVGYTKYNEVINGNYHKNTDNIVAINEQRRALSHLRGNGGARPYKSTNSTTGNPFFWA